MISSATAAPDARYARPVLAVRGRRSFLWNVRHIAAALAVLIVAVACTDDTPRSSGSGDSSTTTADTTEESTTSAVPTTVAEDEFQEAVRRTRQMLEDGEGDVCTISAATSSMPLPATEAQVRVAIEIYGQIFEVAAASLENEDPASAAAIRSMVEQLVAEAEEAGYAPSFLDPDSPPAAFESPEYAAAAQALGEKYTAECTPGAGAAPNDAG